MQPDTETAVSWVKHEEDSSNMRWLHKGQIGTYIDAMRETFIMVIANCLKLAGCKALGAGHKQCTCPVVLHECKEHAKKVF